MKSRWIDKKYFLFDLDGTLYLGNRVISGAKELIDRLRAQQKKILFFTNNSSKSVEDYVKKLNRFGFRAKPDEVVMSTHTVIHYLQSKNIRRVFALGTPSFVKMLKRHGIVHDRLRPQRVLVGFDRTLEFKKLTEACRWVEKSIAYIGAHPDAFCPTDEGLEPDCGSILALIETATKHRPERVLGKPDLTMVQEVRRRYPQFRAADAVLIGDRLQTDGLLAQRARIDFCLTLTGESQRADVKRSNVRVAKVIDSVAELL